jgi:quercetin 2,3-dioxygenase
MLSIRKSEDRGHANFGWLDSRHTFSFGHYFDERFMGFGPLRVINDDHVAPGRGFDTHGHKDMEIISYVLEGGLAHKDSIGTGSVIRPGDVQVMSAGTGIRHSEFNASDTEQVHFLQIWIMPERDGLKPRYEQKTFSEAEKARVWKLVGSRDGREGSVTINADVDLYASRPGDGGAVSHTLAEGRIGWLQVAKGSVALGERVLTAGDGVSFDAAQTINLRGLSADAEVLLFDMS